LKQKHIKRHLKRLLVFALLPLLAACEQPAGTGGPPPSLTIHNAGDLAKIGLLEGCPLDGNYTLAASVELSDWKPIGTSSAPFTGTFDGGGNTVTVRSFAPGAESPYAGVFGYVKNGTLRRVNLAGTLELSREGGESKALFIGVLAGYLQDSRILDCASSAALSAEAAGGPVYAGGLAGYGRGAEISRCRTTGAVTASGQGHNSSAGGIAGYLLKSAVSDCSATGDISLSAVPAADSTAADYLYMIYAGGLLGYTGDGSSTSRSYASGDVYSTSPYPYAGGLVGYNYGDLSGDTEGSVVAECYATGAASARSVRNGIPYAGGLAGYTSQKAVLRDSYATGDAEAESGSKLAWAGGITGACANHGVVSRCYALGNVSALTGTADLVYPQPGVSDGALAGGIAGYVYFTTDTTVEYCAALNASVSASGGGEPFGVHRVVGRAGYPAPPRIEGNIAAAMACIAAPSPDPDLDGADAPAELNEAVFTGLGWDFNAVWKTGAAYPRLRWE
jgi:hypothetical protein